VCISVSCSPSAMGGIPQWSGVTSVSRTSNDPVQPNSLLNINYNRSKCNGKSKWGWQLLWICVCVGGDAL